MSVWSTYARTRQVQEGALSSVRVRVLDVGAADEATLLRAVLEDLGCAVDLYRIGQPRHLVAALAPDADLPPEFLVICGHGEGGRVLMGELAPELAAAQPFNGGFGATEVERFSKVGPVNVISTACESGRSDVADAYLRAGARAYLAPGSEPEGTSAMLLLHLIFYDVIAGAELEQSLARAQSFEPALHQWRLWRQT